METRIRTIRDAGARGLLWLVEHPPVYTAGTSAKSDDLLHSDIEVFSASRGGQYTYHGPGQRVAYVLLDLKALFAPEPPDIRAYVKRLEHWMIATLADLGVEAFTRDGRIGVWVDDPKRGEAKIGAIGIRVTRWVAWHGICLNINPDLSHYTGIVPCGIREYGVTSLHALGIMADMAAVDDALSRQFETRVLQASGGENSINN